MSTENQKEYGPVFRFVNYKVYQESKTWFKEVVSLKGILQSNTELWQILKSNSTSVMMNIAAASTKLPQEAKKYLGYSITSANKVVACLDVACDAGAISPEEYNTLSDGYKGVIIQLKGFIKAIGRTKAKAEQADHQEAAQAEPVAA